MRMTVIPQVKETDMLEKYEENYQERGKEWILLIWMWKGKNATNSLIRELSEEIACKKNTGSSKFRVSISAFSTTQKCVLNRQT